jgi:hypothetical protein
VSNPKCDLSLPRRAGQRRLFEAWNEFERRNEQFQVKKLRGGEYFLAVYRGEGISPPRSRFGNAKEIRQDIKHVCENGVLPRGGVY